jgi:hypothetical protein
LFQNLVEQFGFVVLLSGLVVQGLPVRWLYDEPSLHGVIIASVLARFHVEVLESLLLLNSAILETYESSGGRFVFFNLYGGEVSSVVNLFVDEVGVNLFFSFFSLGLNVLKNLIIFLLDCLGLFFQDCISEISGLDERITLIVIIFNCSGILRVGCRSSC